MELFFSKNINLKQIFQPIEKKSWHSLIIGYVRIEDPERALSLFRRMQVNDSISLSGPASVSLLKAYIALKDLVVVVVLQLIPRPAHAAYSCSSFNQ